KLWFGLQLLPGSSVIPAYADRGDAAGGQSARSVLQDAVGGSAAVLDVDVAAEHRGTPFRVPDVLVPDESTPDLGEFDVGAGVEDAVGNPAHAHAGAVVVQCPNVVVDAEARSAFGVADVEADHVAALKVELGTGSHRPAVPVCGMTVVHVVDTVVGAAAVVEGSADAGEAPGLIKTQVGDDVRHPE